MSRRSIRTLVCSVALLSLLALATPAQAAGWTSWIPDGGILQAAWNWITGIWMPQPTQGQEARKGGIGPASGATARSGRSLGLKSDRSAGIDPNGSSSTTTTCQAGCDKNAGVDPNG